jgi:branched-chain amino acid transport system permease protein
MYFVEQVVNGLTLGSLYGLVALGLALILGVARFVNFAHGQFMMVGAYLLLLLFKEQGIPYILATPAVVCGLLLGGAVLAAAMGSLLESSWRTQMVVTLAMAVILESLAVALFGGVPRVVPTAYSGQIVRMAGLTLSVQRLLVFAVVAAAFVLLQTFLSRTKTGKAMRAVAQHREAAMAMGVDTRQISVITFGLAAALAGLAGALISPLYNVYPAMGTMVTFKALAAVIMGGFGRVNGALAAALIIGVTESLAGGFGLSAYQDTFAFVIMIGVLLLRPHGLFGSQVRA